MTKYIFKFEEGNASMRDELGGKGAGLAEMTTAAANKKKLVVIFQRGAVDGLNVVVPYTEKNYYAMRPTIASPARASEARA